MTDSLVARLREAIDETERIARAVPADGWYEDVAEAEGWNEYHEEVREHIARHDPAAVLRRSAADRKILDAHGQEHDCIELTASGDASVVDGKPWALWETQDTEATGKPCFVIRTLAEAYGVEV